MWTKLLFFALFYLLVLIVISYGLDEENSVEVDLTRKREDKCEALCDNSTSGCIFVCQRVNLPKELPKLPRNVTELIIDSCTMPVLLNYSFGFLPFLTSIEITSSKVKKVSNDAFSMMPNLEKVTITNNSLTSIPANLFRIPSLEHVDLSLNHITDLYFPDIITVKTENISLNLSNNLITHIPNGIFHEFQVFNAVSLYLADNRISNISTSSFYGIKRFNSLDLSRNDFKKKFSLMDIALSIENIYTKELKLVKCHLDRHLDSTMFQAMSRTDIEILDLSENSWEVWPNETLKYLPKLQNLTVNQNPFFAFFEAAGEMENARHVSLASNALLKTQIVGVICKNSPKLEYLDVSSNHFQFKMYLHLSNISKLKTFNFSNNNQRINKARRHMLFNSSMPNLETLTLQNINADWVNYMDLADFVLTNMSKLKELDLSYNKISINSSTIVGKFNGLDNLNQINMSYNNLARASFDALNAFFDQLPTLRTIDLSFNNIQHLPYNLFKLMPNLTSLILEGNRLTTFSIRYLRHNKKLKELWLQRNALTWIDGTMFTKLSLSKLDIRQNAFYCSCDLVKFRKWLNTKNDVSITVLGENQHCKTPDIYQEMTIRTFQLPWIQCDNHLTMVVSISIAAPLLLGSIVAVIISYFRWDIKYWWILRRSRRTRKGYTELSEMGDNRYKYDGFVSYNSADEDWVISHLLPNMEQSPDDVNVKCCFAGRDFIPGKYIADNIVNSINESRKLMFVISEQFIKSQWCAFELEMAHLRQFDEKKNLIVLIFLDKIPKKKLPRKIRLLMRHVTYVEWDANSTRTQRLVWKKLKLSLLDIPSDLTYLVTP